MLGAPPMSPLPPSCNPRRSGRSTTATKTLRDEFAMAALTGLLADPGYDPTANRAASDAYQMADAMMADAMMAERQK
jgi:hypothetical protein